MCVTDGYDVYPPGPGDGSVDGVVLSDDGNEGMAGMFGTTCIFNARNGQMGGDFDVAGPDEVVEDTNDSGIVLTLKHGYSRDFAIRWRVSGSCRAE